MSNTTELNNTITFLTNINDEKGKEEQKNKYLNHGIPKNSIPHLMNILSSEYLSIIDKHIQVESQIEAKKRELSEIEIQIDAAKILIGKEIKENSALTKVVAQLKKSIEENKKRLYSG